MSNYLVVAIKPWNIENFKKLRKSDKKNHWFMMAKKENLTVEKIKRINPRYVFIPHWSWIIPEEIWKKYECVVFHMTDLPYGRGGTPLQNLIIRGHKETKISALKVDEGLDTGDIYYKENLSLAGSAEEIYKRASKTIFNKMIPYMIKNQPIPKKQTGRPVKFKRRRAEQSKISNNVSLGKIYDFIRMLDAAGYPAAFLETKNLKFDFFEVKREKKLLTAKVKIYEK